MSAVLQNAKISWNEAGTPVSDSFGDVYFSNDNGLNETRYVFLQQNGLPERWSMHPHASFIIAETGFGTGLNFLATWQQFNHFRETKTVGNVPRLHFISFEKYPLSRADLRKALDSWPELAKFSQELIKIYPQAVPGCHRLVFENGQITLDLWFGDVNEVLPQVYVPVDGLVDAWFLDGFAPSKNPDMWSEALFQQMYRLCRGQATLATFTAAGFVRRGLAEAGFEMRKAAGYGKKREMLQGFCPKTTSDSPTANFKPSSITIVGGGIAAASLAYLFARRSIPVTLFCKDDAIAESASGNPQGAIYPLLHSPNDTLSQFFASAFDFCTQTIDPILNQCDIPHAWQGVEIRSTDEKSARKNQELLAAGFPETLVYEKDGAVYFPDGGWVSPEQLTKALISEAQSQTDVTIHLNTEIVTLQPTDSGWQLTDQNQLVWQAERVILANGAEIGHFDQTAGLPVTPVRGQITYIEPAEAVASNHHVICGDGYVVPAYQDQQVIGATYARQNLSRELNDADHVENIAKMKTTLGVETIEPKILGGRAALRGVTRDHLPLVGGMRSQDELENAANQFDPQGWQPAPHANLFVAAGFGSRGLCSATFAAEILISQLLSEPLPCSLAVLNDLDPQRRWLKPLYRQWRKELTS